MAPSDMQTPTPPAQAHVAARPEQSSSPVQMQQPKAMQAMDPKAPHQESELGLRGGDRGGCCPGRFCFCIPCPIPCDCCIIPL